jgi:antagonist of KipI
VIEVLRPGLLTTVQDLGRHGHRAEGVPVGGALDAAALRVANALVGNPAGAAGLEITLTGPRLHFHADALAALAGAPAEARLDGEALPALRPIRIRAGETLEIGGLRSGCRTYLAVAGGIDVPLVLGSRGTCLIGRFGGFQGRQLAAGDRLPLGEPGAAARAAIGRIQRHVGGWGARGDVLPPYGAIVPLLPGAHFQRLTGGSRERLFAETFRVGRDSDRMGCRLESAELSLVAPLETVSEGAAVGTVQLPPGGSPIVLMADGGTTGGYPRIGHIPAVDLPLLAQLRPGDSFRFRPISLDEAQRRLRDRERELARLSHVLRLRMTHG